MRQITGFQTVEMGTGDRKRIVGPSSVTVGAGTVYVGNRGDSSVCAFDAKSLAHGVCHTFDSSPDGIIYIAATKEVWVTTPRDKSVRILDATTLAEKAKLTFDGGPEGFAVDGKRGRFYTNLEDKDVTLAIDLKSHKTVATWPSTCGKDGPHGLRADETAGFLFVACSARAEVMNAAHDGAVPLVDRHRRGRGRHRLLTRDALALCRRVEGGAAHRRQCRRAGQALPRGEGADAPGCAESGRHGQRRRVPGPLRLERPFRPHRRDALEVTRRGRPSLQPFPWIFMSTSSSIETFL